MHNFYNLVAKAIQHHDLCNTHTTHSHFPNFVSLISVFNNKTRNTTPHFVPNLT
ncbi:hypothetical protein HMPREF1586_00411 [Gardnerella vaginalis JCP8522]|nr:hypothetical protein HMPREF1586_00411 [Gardnerella vaginalis JCP8522]